MGLSLHFGPLFSSVGIVKAFRGDVNLLILHTALPRSVTQQGFYVHFGLNISTLVVSSSATVCSPVPVPAKSVALECFVPAKAL